MCGGGGVDGEVGVGVGMLEWGLFLLAGNTSQTLLTKIPLS